jgi:hypothetical protein
MTVLITGGAGYVGSHVLRELRADGMCLPSWSLLWDHLITVWSSQLPFTQKLKLTGVVARACRWHQPFWLEELRTLGRVLFAAK